MKNQILDFKNYVLHVKPQELKGDTAILLLHGFPSESFNGTDQEKNEDLLRYLSETTGLEAYLHHYNGLGKSNKGNFSFIDSINDSLELTKLILLKHKNLILIGHSWGGWVAMNCINNLSRSIKKLILLSPLNAIPNTESLESIMESIKKDFPYLTQDKPVSEFVKDLEKVNITHNPRQCINNIDSDSKIYIIQANDDQEVPRQTTDEFQNLFGLNCTYDVMDTDHSFIKNRFEMFNKCRNFIINNA